MLALLPTESDKAAHCHRYESIMCDDCMSQDSPPPPQPSPSSSRPHSSPHSFHQVYSFKKSLNSCLRKIVSFVNFVIAAPTKSESSDSCRKCRRLRAAHKSSCADCQTKMNTKRNTFLGLEALADYSNKTRGTPEVVECSQAFVDHLLHLDSSHPSHNRGRGGVELRSGSKLTAAREPVTGTPELIRVSNIPQSVSLAALDKQASKLNPVSVQRRPHSDGDCPAADVTECVRTLWHPNASSQTIQGTILLTTVPRVPKNDSAALLTVTPLSHTSQQLSSPAVRENTNASSKHIKTDKHGYDNPLYLD